MSDQQPAPLYRIHWRVTSTGATGQSPGTFDREMAELWVNSLNADKDNKAVGLEHWMEPAGVEESGE